MHAYKNYSLSHRFDSLDFVFHPGGCNKVAHVLANYALNCESGARWLGSAPPCVCLEAVNDLRDISSVV